MQLSSPQSPRDRRVEFNTQADERYAKVIASGMTISWNDMRAYLEARIAGKKTKRPMARKIGRAWPL